MKQLSVFIRVAWGTFVRWFCISLSCWSCISVLYHFCISASCFFFFFNNTQAHNSVSTELPEVCVSWVWSPLWHWLTRILGVRTTNQPLTHSTGATTISSFFNNCTQLQNILGYHRFSTLTRWPVWQIIQQRLLKKYRRKAVTNIFIANYLDHPSGRAIFVERLTGLTSNAFFLQMIWITHMAWPFFTFWCTEWNVSTQKTLKFVGVDNLLKFRILL